MSVCPTRIEMIANEFYVYAYFDPCDDLPFYVGKGHGDRDVQHFRPHELKKPYPFYRKLRKMLAQGVQPLVVRLAEQIGEPEAFVLESFLILALGRRNDPLNPGPLWNLTDGGEGASGYVCSEEIRLRISAGKKGKKNSESHNRNIAAARSRMKCSEATKQKIAAQHRGMKATEKARQHMRDAQNSEAAKQRHARQRGRSATEEARRANSVAQCVRRFKMAVPLLSASDCVAANWLNQMSQP